jgi:hypothetical protein
LYSSATLRQNSLLKSAIDLVQHHIEADELPEELADPRVVYSISRRWRGVGAGNGVHNGEIGLICSTEADVLPRPCQTSPVAYLGNFGWMAGHN